MELTFSKWCLLFKLFYQLIKVFETTQSNLAGVGSDTRIYCTLFGNFVIRCFQTKHKICQYNANT